MTGEGSFRRFQQYHTEIRTIKKEHTEMIKGIFGVKLNLQILITSKRKMKDMLNGGIQRKGIGH